jgi:hypothetical protein
MLHPLSGKRGSPLKRYDPAVNPGAGQWLGLDEEERLELVRAHHRRTRVKLPNQNLHAMAHVVVENQLAEKLPVVVETLSRLLAEGLDRHDAIHAIGGVLMEHIWNLGNTTLPGGDPHAPYFAALQRLNAASWRSSG